MSQNTNLDLGYISEQLDKWFEAKKNAEYWVEQERTLRKDVFGYAFAFPKPGKKNKLKIEHGMALIGDYKLNYKIDQPALTDARSAGEIPNATINQVISWTPKIRDAQFEALDNEMKVKFAAFVTIEPGLPGLEVKEASKVRWGKAED